jgi:hypothetical protein
MTSSTLKSARPLRKLAGIALALGTLSLLGAGVAVAQGAPQAAPPAQASPAQAAPVQAGLERQVSLTPQEQSAQADVHLARMESARDNVRRALMSAREERDVVKTLCLNDKLSQLNVAVSSAQERRDALASAVKQNDADLASHEFSILSVLRQRSDQLATEANQCIGEEIGMIGQSAVTTTIDDLPEDDSSDYPIFDVLTDPPSCTSCVL